MSKPFVLGFIVGVALLIVAGVGASRLQRRDAGGIDAGAEEREYQAKIVDATPVQLGVLTAKQRVHGSLFNEYQERRGGKTISRLVEQAKGKSRMVKTIAFVGCGSDLIGPETPGKYFGELAHESDAVIHGTALKKASQITEDDAFVFTDYDVVVKEVLKNNSDALIDTGATIIVTRPGGRVLVDGIIVEAEDMAFEPLPINSNDVVLFLN